MGFFFVIFAIFVSFRYLKWAKNGKFQKCRTQIKDLHKKLATNPFGGGLIFNFFEKYMIFQQQKMH